MLTGNLEKITEHGRRADGVVKSMLEHSRGSSGECRTVDLSNLIEGALNLAYHGARAQDASFISYDIVTQEHGGTIIVDSQIGEFAEFTVRLPRSFGATIAEAAS
jgi:hypothetical protein